MAKSKCEWCWGKETEIAQLKQQRSDLHDQLYEGSMLVTEDDHEMLTKIVGERDKAQTRIAELEGEVEACGVFRMPRSSHAHETDEPTGTSTKREAASMRTVTYTCDYCPKVVDPHTHYRPRCLTISEPVDGGSDTKYHMCEKCAIRLGLRDEHGQLKT